MRYPDFYKKRKGFLKEDEPELFTGREEILKKFWKIMVNWKNLNRIENIAILSFKKVGKTALLKRFLNIVYEEQDKIIPLYYEFNLNERKKELNDVGNDIVCTFIKQALSFYTKDRKILEINNLAKLKSFLVDNKLKDKDKIYNEMSKLIENYESKRDELTEEYEDKKVRFDEKEEKLKKEIIREALNSSMKILEIIEKIKKEKRKIVIGLDEVQNLIDRLIDEKEKEEIIKREEIIKINREKRKLTEEERRNIEEEREEIIINCRSEFMDLIFDSRVWVLLTGSQAFIRENEMLDGMKRIIKKIDIGLLNEKETEELINRLIKKNNIKEIYKDIQKDIYKLVKGHPFYIKCILDNNKREKSFKNRTKLGEILEFEVNNNLGNIYKFWEKNFLKDLKILVEREHRYKTIIKIMKVIKDEVEKLKNKILKGEKIENIDISIKFPEIMKKIKKIEIGDVKIEEEEKKIYVEDRIRELDKGGYLKYDKENSNILIEDKVIPLMIDLLYDNKLKSIVKVGDEKYRNFIKHQKYLEKYIEEKRNDGDFPYVKGRIIKVVIENEIKMGNWIWDKKYKLIEEPQSIRVISFGYSEKGITEKNIDSYLYLRDKKTYEELEALIEVMDHNTPITPQKVVSTIEKFEVYRISSCVREKANNTLRVIVSRKGVTPASFPLLNAYKLLSYRFDEFIIYNEIRIK